jgi:hypothetical protein
MAQYVPLLRLSSSFVDTPDTAAHDVTNLEVRVRIALDDWTPSQQPWVLEKLQSGTDSFLCALGDSGEGGNAGAMRVQWFDGSSLQSLYTNAAIPAFGDGTIQWLAWTLDVDNGAGDADLKCYYSSDTTEDDTAVSWTQVGTTVSLGSTTSIANGDSVLSASRNAAGAHGSVGGKMYQDILLDDIGGSSAAHLNLNDFTAGDSDTDTAVAVTGETWTLHGAGVVAADAVATCVVTGHALTAGGLLASEIVAGGETLVLTLTNDTWVATVGADNAITTALIAGITSAGAEGTGWNVEVRDNLSYLNVARTSDTVVTIPLPPSPDYAITANESVTITVPATALTAAGETIATPTFPVVAGIAAASVWIDTARYLIPHFAEARTDRITTARTTAAGTLNTTTGVISAPTTSTPLAAVGATIRYGNLTTVEFGQEATDRATYTIFLTFDADITTDDRVTINACALDAGLIGDVMIVKAVDQDTFNPRKAAVCELAT